MFKTSTYNEEAGPQEYSFHPDIQVHREGDTKVVSIGEHLSEETGPLLGNLPHYRFTVLGQYLKQQNNIKAKLN